MNTLKALQRHFAQILNKNISTKDLRIFLGIWSIICLIFALTPLLNGVQMRLWLLVICAFCIACLPYPTALRPIYRIWLIFGEIMGFCISRTILFVLFFWIFTPIAIIFRIVGRDCLTQQFERDKRSYFIERKEKMHSMKEQF